MMFQVRHPRGSVAGRWQQFLAAFVLAPAMLLSGASDCLAESQGSAEYRIKAAFLYNFTRFIHWPVSAGGEQTDMRVCIIGEDKYGKALNSIVGKKVRDRALVIERRADLGNAGTNGTCHIVVFGRLDQAELSRLIGQPVLTIGDTPGFAVAGGIIEFHLVENKVRFKINREAADAAGLSVSSRLLGLATSIIE